MRRRFFFQGAAAALLPYSSAKALLNAAQHTPDCTADERRYLAEDNEGIENSLARSDVMPWLPGRDFFDANDPATSYKARFEKMPKGLFAVPMEQSPDGIARLLARWRVDPNEFSAGTGFHIGNGVFLTNRHVIEGFTESFPYRSFLSDNSDLACVLIPEGSEVPRLHLWLGSPISYQVSFGTDSGPRHDSVLSGDHVLIHPGLSPELYLLASAGFSPIANLGKDKYGGDRVSSNLVARAGMSGGPVFLLDPFTLDLTNMVQGINVNVSDINIPGSPKTAICMSQDRLLRGGILMTVPTMQAIKFITHTPAVRELLPEEVLRDMDYQLRWWNGATQLKHYYQQDAANPAGSLETAVAAYIDGLSYGKMFCKSVGNGAPTQLAYQVAAIIDDFRPFGLKLLNGQSVVEAIETAARDLNIEPKKTPLSNGENSFFKGWSEVRSATRPPAPQPHIAPFPQP
jgi:hypothetical protein